MNLFKERLMKISLYQELRKKFFSTPNQEDLVTCPQCQTHFTRAELQNSYSTCSNCNYLFQLKAHQRIDLVCDPQSFKEVHKSMKTELSEYFEGYQEKLVKAKEQSGLNEAFVYGKAQIKQKKVIIGVLDASFMMGSMGSIVGEKVTSAIELSARLRHPLILFSASGGARMQEGIQSLIQMAKTSAALKEHDSKGLLFISVLTHPTTGGVSASFAMLGDIILAEPHALIGFAGKRVIAQTIKEELPKDFQSAEFTLEHGFIDHIVERKNLRETLSLLLEVHQGA